MAEKNGSPMLALRKSRARLFGLLVTSIFAVLTGLSGAEAEAAAAPSLAEVASGPSWTQLTPGQRAVLAPLESSWGGVSPDAKQKWIEMAGSFRTMSPAEKQRIQRRMADWVRMTPEQRGEARLNFQQARQVPVQERQARWEAYQALSPAEKKALAERASPAAGRGSAAGNGRAASRSASVAGLADQTPKTNLVAGPGPGGSSQRSVAATVIRADRGATTTLVTTPVRSPPHQQVGLPKIAAGPGFVDRSTLLPQRGLQGAGARSSAPVATAALPRASLAAPATAVPTGAAPAGTEPPAR